MLSAKNSRWTCIILFEGQRHGNVEMAAVVGIY